MCSREGRCKEEGMGNKKRISPYKPCSYCGENLALRDGCSKEDLRKRNMKPHLALTHTLDICYDAGIEVDDEENGASFKSFLSQLHFITSVIGMLESNNYAVKPACTCFFTMNRETPVEDAGKIDFFADFVKESREAFNKYRVVYLRGASIPSSFKDLLPAAVSNYKDVLWEGGKRPRSNEFSVEKLLTAVEKESMEQEVAQRVQEIIEHYSRIVIAING